MRPLVVLLAALALVGPAVGANGQPRQALTKADQKKARSVVLTRSDLDARFVAQKGSGDETLPKSARCGALDESDLTVTGDVDSPDYRLMNGSAFVTVGSTAQVYRTLREANASWRRGTPAQTATCLADIIRLTAPKDRRVTIVSAGRRTFPNVAPKSSAYRIVAGFVVNGRRIHLFVDVILLQEGRIQTGLLFSSVGAPVARSEQVDLAKVVARRLAIAAGLSGPVA
jgi:hypothetical protein